MLKFDDENAFSFIFEEKLPWIFNCYQILFEWWSFVENFWSDIILTKEYRYNIFHIRHPLKNNPESKFIIHLQMLGTESVYKKIFRSLSIRGKKISRELFYFPDWFLAFHG